MTDPYSIKTEAERLVSWQQQVMKPAKELALAKLKEHMEWMKTELRVWHKLSPQEANLAVKQACIQWGRSLGLDITFDEDDAWQTAKRAQIEAYQEAKHQRWKEHDQQDQGE